MATTNELKAQIDAMDYEELLGLWRHTPAGVSHPFFQGEVGTHYLNVMNRKKREIGAAAAVAASKKIGW